MVELEKEVTEEKAELEKVRKKHKKARDDLFSKTMQIDQLRTKIGELEEKLSEYEDASMEDQASAGLSETSVVSEKNAFLKNIEEECCVAEHFIFVLLPNISYISEINMLNNHSNDLMHKQVQVACNANMHSDFQKIQDLRNKGIKFSNITEENQYCLVVDDRIALLGYGRTEDFFGLKSTNKQFISLIKAIIINPFKNK